MVVVPITPHLLKLLMSSTICGRDCSKPVSPTDLRNNSCWEGTITLNFSPASRKQNIGMTSGMIAYFLEQASSSVHIAVFVYSDQQISDTVGCMLRGKRH